MYPRSKTVYLLVTLITVAGMIFLVAACGGEEETGVVEEPGGGAGAAAEIDACGIVTQSDASALFGRAAVKDEGSAVLDPGMIGECLWGWDTETSAGLLQFRVWNSPQYYSAPADSQPFDIGEQAYIRVHEIAGVDIEWVQDGKTIDLSYFTTGPDAPPADAKTEEVKNLARKVAAEL